MQPFWGIVIHMMMSAAAGMVFGLFAHCMSAVIALVVGLIYGVLIWAVMTWLVLPIVNQVMLDRVMIAPSWWFAFHLIFGAMLLLTPALVSAFGRDRSSARRNASGRDVSTHPA